MVECFVFGVDVCVGVEGLVFGEFFVVVDVGFVFYVEGELGVCCWVC